MSDENIVSQNAFSNNKHCQNYSEFSINLTLFSAINKVNLTKTL